MGNMTMEYIPARRHSDIGYLYRAFGFTSCGGLSELYVVKLPILRMTPCGYWVREKPDSTQRKFVLKVARKRYAYPTIREAVESFIARKHKERSLVATRLLGIDTLLAEAEGKLRTNTLEESLIDW